MTPRDLAPWLAKIPQPWRTIIQICLASLGVVLLMLILGVILSLLVVLPWAVATYGEAKHSDPQLCADRSHDIGFAGSPDFYGLGIRAGIYMQWLASLIANCFLPDERRSMAGAYACFAFALLVAVLLLIFQDGCAYTAEIIVLLNVLWGGTILVLLPFIKVVDKSKKGDKSRGLQVVEVSITLPLIPITAWFWLRQAIVGQVDFATTPGGTSFFVFYHVTEDDFNIACRMMAFMCLWICCSPAIILPLGLLGKMPAFQRVSRLLVALLVGPVWLGLLLALFVRLLKFLADSMYSVSQWFSAKHDMQAKYRTWRDGSTVTADLLQWTMAIFGLFIMVCSVISIELTLKWNNVTDVYDVDSTGQIIPLIVGLGIMTTLIWKLSMVSDSRKTTDREIESGLRAGLQQFDSTWS